MDRGKRLNKFIGSSNNKIYMDLKDIIREHTLPFLPAKSLFRFQGVCRDWKLQISTPFFAHNQSLSFHAISGFFFQSPAGSPSFVSIDAKSCGVPDPSLKFLPDPVDIVGSSNGLLCCLGLTGDKAYYICNPATKQWKKLPKPNAVHGPDPAIVLVFEPSLFNFVAEYRLICAFPSADFDNATEFEIYSSTEGSWKISGEICFASRKPMPRSGIHVNGVVYWQSKHSGILAFDLKKERSQLIKGYYGVKGSLGVIDGKLCTAHATGRAISVNMLSNVYSNTMEMSSNARTWEEKSRINLDAAVVGELSFDEAMVVFAGSNKLFVQSGKRLISYDLKTKETAVLTHAVELNMRCVSYVNNLVYI
ncbi:F-box protein At5g07610-like [Cornus florida]|uniref:F-box protein At5g07610-like n=1 Tax=Cornus florida TaxID=4283 RepID=UPI00289E348C|nr:F-box protein At5g07610-like [Cornus florida]XP_059642172.1 F-box protein At5g07610-like [Cornus florida]